MRRRIRSARSRCRLDSPSEPGAPPVGPLSIATNVAENDDTRIATTVPHWIRMAGGLLSEIVVVVDMQPRSSRMADSAHRVTSGIDATLEAVERLARSDSRVKVVLLDERTPADVIDATWFTHGHPRRCQVGSPIFGYILAIESTSGEMVLKMDCDMLFHDAGWLEAAGRVLREGRAHVVEPWRLELGTALAPDISTRIFAIHKQRFREEILPVEPRRLDWPRRIHRRLHGRPTWLPLEQTLSHEARSGRIRYEMLPRSLGFSVHVPHRDHFLEPGFDGVVEDVERGRPPRVRSWNYVSGRSTA